MFVRDTILDWTCCEACVAEDADFKEGEHPRNDKGEFSSGPGQAPSDLESLRLARQQAALAYEAIAGKKQPKKKVELAREALLRAAQAHNEALLTAGYDPLTGKKNRDPEAYIPRYLAWAKESGVHARLERGDGYAKELAQAFLAGAEGDKMPSLGWRREEHVAELKSAYTEGQKADPEKGAANYFSTTVPAKDRFPGQRVARCKTAPCQPTRAIVSIRSVSADCGRELWSAHGLLRFADLEGSVIGVTEPSSIRATIDIRFIAA